MTLGGQVLVTPPEINSVEAPSSATIVCQGDTFTFKLDQALADNGAPSAAAPKIFFRYYLVDSSTGVKSQVMLAETKWEAGA